MNELPSETDPAPSGASPQEPLKGPLQQHRGMVILVVVMGIVLVVGFGILVATIIYRASGGNSQQEDAPAAIISENAEILSVVRPAGATLLGATSNGGRMTLHFQGESGDVVLVVELASGAVVSRIEIPATFTERK